MFDSILLLFALHASVARVDAPAPPEVRGAFVEARTASVFAGACHYGAEATTGGREAVVAWRFDSGSHLGVNLAGVEIILNMRERMAEMHLQIQEFVNSLNQELASRSKGPELPERNSLIPVIRIRRK